MATGGTGDLLTGMIARLVRAAARRRGGLQARRLPARHGRRPRRGRRRGSRADRRRHRRAPRRRGARADRAPARQADARSSTRPPCSRPAGHDRQQQRRRRRRPPASARRGACAPATSCCCSAISARARPRSSAAWRAGSARPADDVSSPTFTLVQEYRGRADAVSRRSLPPRAGEVDDLGLDELIAGDAVVAIEWAERWHDAPNGRARCGSRTTGTSSGGLQSSDVAQAQACWAPSSEAGTRSSESTRPGSSALPS